eukprot:m.64029 g.64029  ORF g.64029 m.64029 type:complete len:426 (-) comp11988_c0_seq1:1173-2450(-)
MSDQTPPVVSQGQATTSLGAVADSLGSMALGSQPQTSQSPAEEEVNNTNLIVNYLPPDITQEEFAQLFSRFGAIKSYKLMRDRQSHKSLGYGFVDYVDPAGAENAIRTMSGYQIKGKRLKVSLARPSSTAITRANLYIKNIPVHVTEDELARTFGQHGDLISYRILRSSDTGESKGVGFVRFDKRESAEQAVQMLEGRAPFGGDQTLVVKFADNSDHSRDARHMHPSQMMMGQHHGHPGVLSYRPMAPGAPGTVPPSPEYLPACSVTPKGFSLFVFNLAPVVEDQTLYEVFSRFGSVTSTSIARHPQSQQPKGYGFVTMPNYHEAARAVQQGNGTFLAGRYIEVSFKTMSRKNPRRDMPMHQHAPHAGMSPQRFTPPPPLQMPPPMASSAGFPMSPEAHFQLSPMSPSHHYMFSMMDQQYPSSMQ